jgi:integrase
LLRLRWEDLDLEEGSVTFWITKNGRVRSVPLPKQALEVLVAHPRGDSPYLFKSRLKDNQSTLWRAWDLARKKAKLREFRFHDLRHTFASYLAKSGASLFEIGELMGHRKLESTLIYVHMIKGHNRSIVERMADTFFGGENTK